MFLFGCVPSEWQMYEKNKHDPIIPRDAPPAAGAIYWSRQLLSHIEEPMKVRNLTWVHNCIPRRVLFMVVEPVYFA